MQIVSPLVGKSEVKFPEFHFTQEDKTIPELSDEPFFILHPYAKDETRRYPVSYWGQLVNRLRSQFKVKFVVVGSKEDGVLPELGDVLYLAGKLSLPQTAFLMTKAKAFIGVSSGPAHLASVIGVPTVVLSGGVSFPSEWSPVGKSLLLRSDVPCAPCHSRTCQGYGLACLNQLTPDKVLPEVLDFLTATIEPRR
jgi:heptosyltransferase-1